MCGIAGIIGGNDEVLMSHMLDKIKHRGDSSPKYDVIDNAVLGSVHLRIVDQNNGGQPIYNEDNTIAIVFNGEIYNYLDLKDDLKAKGHKFRTTCDTEVLIHLYEEYKEDMLLRLDGMFAFLIYDNTTNTFFGARDFFGIKPFYYCWDKGVYYFSSEMKSFQTIDVKEINELPPSHYVLNGFINRYYDAPLIRNKYRSFNIAKLKVRE